MEKLFPLKYSADFWLPERNEFFWFCRKTMFRTIFYFSSLVLHPSNSFFFLLNIGQECIIAPHTHLNSAFSIRFLHLGGRWLNLRLLQKSCSLLGPSVEKVHHKEVATVTKRLAHLNEKTQPPCVGAHLYLPPITVIWVTLHNLLEMWATWGCFCQFCLFVLQQIFFPKIKNKSWWRHVTQSAWWWVTQVIRVFLLPFKAGAKTSTPHSCVALRSTVWH